MIVVIMCDSVLIHWFLVRMFITIQVNTVTYLLLCDLLLSSRYSSTIRQSITCKYPVFAFTVGRNIECYVMDSDHNMNVEVIRINPDRIHRFMVQEVFSRRKREPKHRQDVEIQKRKREIERENGNN